MLHAGVVAALTTWQEAKRELVSAEAAAVAAQDVDRRDIDRFNRARQSGTPEAPSPRAAAAQTTLDRARDREGSRRRGREASEAAWQVADRLLAAVRELLRTSDDPAGRRAPELLLPIVVERRGPKSPPDVAVDLERVRALIAAVTEERTALAVAPVPFDEATTRLDEWIDDLAQQWQPPLAIEFAAPDYRPPSADAFWPFKPFMLLAALTPVRDLLRERLMAAYAQLPGSVPSAERQALAADLATRQRQLELQEEHLILEAAENGMAIARRPDADAAVVLCVVLAE